MSTYRYIWRSLRHYKSAHLWIVLGGMMCTAVLVGALVVGDSVRYSLQRMVTDRLGRTRFALSSGDRFFQASLADRLSGRLETPVAPLLLVKGIVVADGGQKRANRVSVVGVDGRFGEIGQVPDLYDTLSPGDIIVNSTLAAQLKLKAGDQVLLRLEQLSGVPRDAPLSDVENQTVASRFVVKAIADVSAFGGFNLQSNQVTPGTAFVSRPALARMLELEGRANGLLAAGRPDAPLSELDVTQVLRETWTLADASLEWRTTRDGKNQELRSTRVFMDPGVLEAASQMGEKIQPVLTYFVNGISKEALTTPYSFVSAPGLPIVPDDLGDREIIINRWLSEDLQAVAGDRVQVRYYVLERMGRLRETTATFHVRQVVPLEGIYADADLLPDFPGLAGEAHCRDWEAGIPVDYDRIRQKDEDYWTEFRGTPKAFVTLSAAQKMWQNRFGNLTAIRFEAERKDEVEKKLTQGLDPGQFGLTFRDIKQEGLRASAQSVDFSQLFLGLSFFVILASLILVGLLFVFHIQTRSQETGLLLALGFTPRAVRRLVLLEGALLACAGSLLGGLAGIGVNQLILQALMTVWSGAVGTAPLQMDPNPLTILTGICIGALLAICTIWLVVRKQTQQSVIDLQKGIPQVTAIRVKTPATSVVMALLCLTALVALLVLYPAGGGRAVMGVYFAAGALVFAGGTALVGLLIHASRRFSGFRKLSRFRISLHNLGRRRHRSLTLVGLLACGLFLVFTVGANRKSATVGASLRESGTGGFALYAETAVPVLHDLNLPQVQSDYGLESEGLGSARFVQFRVKDGDDASCLNLNRVSHPRLLGVDPGELAARKAFTFSSSVPDIDPLNPWHILDRPLDGAVVPAVADLTVILWGLGKSVGDTLTYADEMGRAFNVRLVAGLANSVFQGSLIISEDHLIRKFPSLSGYRLFLIDSPEDSLAQVSRSVSWALQDHGIDLVRASDRLAAFNQVENTYLSIFLILGSFGLILGSIGIGIVVLRNIQEQRGELALLRAVGYSKATLRGMISIEYLILLLAGTLLGVASALTATYPTLATGGAEIPYPTIILLLLLVLANGGFWIHLATTLALRRPLLPALRNE